VLEPGKKLYRIRLNPKEIKSHSHIDTTPQNHGPSGRFDSSALPVFYACLDVETCIHETRTRVGDEIVVGTLELLQPQKLADFSTLVIDHQSETNHANADVYYFLRGRLTNQEALDYRICQTLALLAHRRGFDGITHRSFFSLVRTAPAHNVVLFGFPVQDKKVRLISWNQIQIRRVSYEFQFGPLLHTLHEVE
jgi:RES domain